MLTLKRPYDDVARRKGVLCSRTLNVFVRVMLEDGASFIIFHTSILAAAYQNSYGRLKVSSN